MIKASVCIATRNKAPVLKRVLDSILTQRPGFKFETIIVDDGSTDHTREVCSNVPCTYVKLNNPEYRNPSVARNFAMKLAKGDILVLQSDDVVHGDNQTIEKLVNNTFDKNIVIASVWNRDGDRIAEMYTGPNVRKAFFFLGSVKREHVYKIGGNSEDFKLPSYEDDWFASCLEKGLGLEAEFRSDIIGYHTHHERACLVHANNVSRALFHEKSLAQSYFGNDAWPYADQKSYVDLVSFFNGFAGSSAVE